MGTLRSINGEIFGEIPGSSMGKFFSIFDSGLGIAKPKNAAATMVSSCC